MRLKNLNLNILMTKKFILLIKTIACIKSPWLFKNNLKIKEFKIIILINQ